MKSSFEISAGQEPAFSRSGLAMFSERASAPVMTMGVPATTFDSAPGSAPG